MAKKISELTAASGASSTSPLPMVQGGVTLGVEAGALVRSSTSLGNMQSLVQSLIDTASVANKARENHTGTDAAANVLMADGSSVEDAITSLRQAVAGGGASVPTIDTAPTIGGTTTVGETLTFTPGTVTNSGGRSSTNIYRPNIVGVTDGSYLGAGVTTYVIPPSAAGLTMTVTQKAVDTVNSLLFSERTSAETAAIAVVVPTNTIAPTITPTGSQAVGTVYSFASEGVWDDATPLLSTEYQWMVSDADVDGSTAATFTSSAGQEGGVVKGKIRKTTAQGTSAWATSSNSSTVSGSAALTEVTPPSLPATVTLDVPSTVTDGVWSETVTVLRTRLYADAATTPYAVWEGTGAVFSTANNSWMISQTQITNPPGITDLTGHTLYVDQQVSYLGVTYTSSKSAGEVVQAASATLAARTDTSAYSWTQNTAISSSRPIVGIYGTGGPYTYSVSPALPSGLSYNTSTGYISGIPTVTAANATYTVTVSDGVGTPVTATFTAVVSAASVTALTKMFPFDVEANGVDQSWVIGDPAIVGSDTAVRWGVTTDPGGSGQQVIIARVKSGDGSFDYGGNRAECVFRYDPSNSSNATSSSNSFLWRDHTYWMAFAFRMPTLSSPVGWPSDQSGDDRQLFFQVHANNSNVPVIAFYYKGTAGTNTGKIFYDMVISEALDGSIDSQPTFGTPWTPTTGVWIKHIVKWRTAWPSGAILDIWRAEGSGAYTQVVASTTSFGYRYAESGYGVSQADFEIQDYPKFGIYKFGLTYNTYTDRYIHLYGLYKQEGDNLYAEAAKALESI